MSWWFYALAVVVVIVGIVAFLFYRGYKKMQPKPLEGIPCPPLSHPVLGHPERMVHPVKHETRLEISEAAQVPIHQLLFMKQSSIFVNDAREVAKVIKEFPSKGRIYGPFRYDINIPDILACDGDAFFLRKSALKDAFANMEVDSQVTADLLSTLLSHSESGLSIDMKRLLTLYAFDCVCRAAFEYDLGGVAGSEEGERLYQALETLTAAQQSQALYNLPGVEIKVVSKEQVERAKADWRTFLIKLVGWVKQQAEIYRQEHHSMIPSQRLTHALYQLSQVHEGYNDAELQAEIHQVLRHGHETIAGTLMWFVYALYRNKKVRITLEKAISDHKDMEDEPYPEYLEMFIKEALRRYPVAGNMTVRTAHGPQHYVAGVEMPIGVPVHLHMYSLHNSAKTWNKPKEFKPERWMMNEQDSETSKSRPQCPFLGSLRNNVQRRNATNNYEDYSGLGFSEDSLSYFPFSAGERECLGKHFALKVLRKSLYDLASSYHLDAVEEAIEDDLGNSVNTVIVPLYHKTMIVKVSRVISLACPTDASLGSDTVLVDDGWAEED